MSGMRLECLRLAVEAHASDPVAEAQRFFDFVTVASGDLSPPSGIQHMHLASTSDPLLSHPNEIREH